MERPSACVCSSRNHLPVETADWLTAKSIADSLSVAQFALCRGKVLDSVNLDSANHV